MTESYLKFVEEPRYHVIVYCGEEKSEPLYTRVQAFKKITDLANNQKVSPADFAKMRDEIFQEDSLPWEENGPREITIEVIGPGFGFPSGLFDESPFGFGSIFGNPFGGRSRNPLAFLGELEMLSGVLEAIMEEEEAPVEKPTFVPCKKCKEKHGKIRTKESMTTFIDSKEKAMDALGEMLKRKLVTKEEAEEVEKQIIEFFTK